MTDNLRMYILTDVHYESPKLWEEGDPINNRQKGDQIAIKDTPRIFDTFIDKILADADTRHILITGDLINSGEKINHDEFRSVLKRLTEAGKRVYVTTATHDYCGHNEDGDENIFHASYYGAEACREAERVSKKELRHLYDDFGPNFADSVDSESGSYSLKLEDGYRLIAINDNGNGRSHCGLFEEGFNWLKNEIRKANAAGEYILLAVHHPVLPPWEAYRLAADFEMYGGYEDLKKLMCEENVRVIFTGHTHVQNVSRYTDSEGRYFYDISTTALVSAAGKMRLVRAEGKKCTVTSIGIDKIKGVDTGDKSAYEYLYGLNFAGALENAMPYIFTDWERFTDGAKCLINENLLNGKKKLIQTGYRLFGNTKMSLIACIGGRKCGLSEAEKKYLKGVKVTDVIFRLLRCVFPGNAPFTPDTAEFKAIDGVLKKTDRILDLIKFDKNKLLNGLTSVEEIAVPFLYNNRTGDDDSIIFELK